jgi:threonyl-tRNA synthetase
MKNVSGKEDTALTVQYDFVGPKRFELRYIDSDGKEKEPIVIHRSSIGAIERTMAFLIEHYAGAFPVWMSPVQVMVVPISDKNLEYAAKVEAELKAIDVRVQVDNRNERMNQKIREAQLQKIPYMLVVGDKEAAENKVAVRLRSGEQLPVMSLDDFKTKIKQMISERVNELKP